MKIMIAFLLAIVLQATSYAQTVAPEQVGGEMFNSLVPTRASENNQYMRQHQGEAMAAMIEWNAALKESVGKTLNGPNLTTAILNMGELYENGRFQPAKSSEMASRMKSVPKQTLTAWKLALNTFETGVDELNTILFMVRQPAMFAGSTLNPVIASRQLKRLQTLPKNQASRWAKVTDSSEAPAALSLIKMDALFRGTVFQKTVFDAALPHAEKLVREFKKK